MFADDSTIDTHGDSIEELNFKLNNDVKSINDWCNQNRMCINLAKSKGMVNSTSQKLRHQPIKYLNVKIGDDCIENVNSHKILGVVVDHRLNWSIQVKNIAKVNIGIVSLRRIDKLMPIAIDKYLLIRLYFHILINVVLFSVVHKNLRLID